ncbi:saccharopine dehydrogenase-like oxidoreductase [Thiovulum sp. ES]|nr:saccharopine dehydrogenase-like oxidoreductase [Thiovulum sp. ES]
MGTVLIIGAGGVGRVVAHKTAQNRDVFSKIILASRTISKCEKIASEIAGEIVVDSVNADEVDEVISLIKKHSPDIVVNVALPYQDLAIMDACIATGVHYLDTANYEHPDTAHFEYKEQWARNSEFENAGILGVLGSGFDPGVTNIFVAYAQKHLLDEIHTIDILDCNDGDHGYHFATNFNPEINIREITANGRYWENGEWIEVPALSEKIDWEYPEIGTRDSYLIYHEEMESIVKNIPHLKRVRFFMTFSEKYLTHLRVLENIGMTAIEPINFEGKEIVPLQFLKAILPDPATLGERTKGQTNIGIYATGLKNGVEKTYYIYNVADHEEAYRDTKANGVSFTTGVPAMIGAKLVLENKWSGKGVKNMEEFDPDPFMEELNLRGLPWKVLEIK